MSNSAYFSSLLKNLDLNRYFKDFNVSYKHSGPNIGKGWVGIEKCPYCGKPKYHFGIKKTTKNVCCWVCFKGKSESFFNYLMVAHKLSFREALSYVEKNVSESGGKVQEELLEERVFASECMIWKRKIYKDFPERFKKFLFLRGLNSEIVVKTFNLMATEPIDVFCRNGVLIPFFYKGKLVTYIVRSIHEKIYKNCPISESVLDPKTTIYNIDSCKEGETLVVTEGCFDVINMGNGFCSTSGTKWTLNQVIQIIEKKPKRVFILFDPEEEALKSAIALAKTLNFFIKDVEVLNLNIDDDLGSLSYKEAIYLRKQIGLKGNRYGF